MKDRYKYNNTLGKLVQRLRHERGMTCAGLAKAVGIDPSMVRLIETGKRLEPGCFKVCRLEDALGVSRGTLTRGYNLP